MTRPIARRLSAKRSILVLLPSLLGSTACSNSASRLPAMPSASSGSDGTGTGGATGDGGGTGTNGGAGAGAGGGPVHTARPCPTDMASVGVWENITPQLQRDNPSYTGMLVPLVDPSDPATVYATSDSTGIFKSADCGATWVSPATGRGHAEMKSGRQWSAVMDQNDPQTLYVINGYGAFGLWKTSNGGVDWDQLFAPNSVVATAVPSLFLERVVIDPTDHTHLLVNFHADCEAGHAPACFAESKDAGSTWKIINGPAGGGWAEGSGVLMVDSKSWLYATWFGGLWHTADEGATWAQVTAAGANGASDQLYKAPDGSYYLATLQGVTRSLDATKWTLIANSGGSLHAMIGEWSTTPSAHLMQLFAAQQNGNNDWYSALETAPTIWTKLDASAVPVGNAYLFGYDPDHHILYVTLQAQGLWRMRTY